MASNSKQDSYRGRGRHARKYDNRGRQSHQHERTKRSHEQDVDENSSVIKSFRVFQEELDSRNDRHERIVKLSRDITIESKRIIFFLQRVTGSDDKNALLTEAAEKLHDLNSTKFLALAKELEGQDPFQFLRAFSPGLQEYIEAVTFYHYQKSKELVDIDTIQPQLTFTTASTDKEQSSTEADGTQPCVESTTDKMTNLETKDKDSHSTNLNTPVVRSEPHQHVEKLESNSSLAAAAETTSSTSEKNSNFHQSGSNIAVPILPLEYMLGVADFTGELMRMAINSVGAGDMDVPLVVSNMMRIIHDAFTTLNHAPREFRQKTRVLRQSLQKVENACYALKVRGTEIPKHMLADVFSASSSLGPSETFTTDEQDEFCD